MPCNTIGHEFPAYGSSLNASVGTYVYILALATACFPYSQLSHTI